MLLISIYLIETNEYVRSEKSVGKGNCLGMAISYQIVVEKHGGMITCASESSRGTEFAISLPLS